MSDDKSRQIFSAAMGAIGGALVGMVFAYLTLGVGVSERLTRLETKMDLLMDIHSLQNTRAANW